jgi:hypothetical protein
MAIFQISGPEGAENALNRTLRGLAATRLATPLLRFRRQTTPRSSSPNRNSQWWCVHACRWECSSVPQAFLPMMAQDPLVLSFIKQKRLRTPAVHHRGLRSVVSRLHIRHPCYYTTRTDARMNATTDGRTDGRTHGRPNAGMRQRHSEDG